MSFSFPTPLGPLRLSVAVDREPAPFVPGPLRAPATAAWHLGSSRATLSVIPIATELHGSLAVTAATALLLRIGGAAATPASTIRITLEGDPRRGGADSGQYLEAFTWTSDGWELSLGMQDHEALADRAERGVGLPPRLAQELRTTSPITYLPSGFEVRVPALAPRETLVLCFAVAWAVASPDHECEPWFAVDLGTPVIARLLEAAG